MTDILNKRACGLLLHIISLPSHFGIGDFGKEAFKFVDFLKQSGQAYWQILPMTPVTASKYYSPYASPSAFAGNELFISPEILYEDNLLKKDILQTVRIQMQYKKENPHIGWIDYRKVKKNRKIILNNVFYNFTLIAAGALKDEFEEFILKNDKNWLDDFACFLAFKNYFYKKSKISSWRMWPEKIKKRDAYEVSLLKKELYESIQNEKILQFLFFRQWRHLKKYAGENKIKIIGDIPVYVDYESSDVWSNPEIFKLSRDGRPLYVSGVPPDYFSRTGQLWNNPVYDWQKLKKSGFEWWIKRIKHNLGLYDLARIDHFRGFIAYWEVPGGNKTAENGKWVRGYPRDFFNELSKKTKNLNIIAENLGVITPEVTAVMKDFNFPGIKVLQFAFGDDFPNSDYLPHKTEPHSVVYTGTHDNNTLLGWFEEDATKKEKKNLSEYIKKTINSDNVCDQVINLAMNSSANLIIIPVQDLLKLGSSARMNRPSTIRNNWKWQLTYGQLLELTLEIKKSLYKITEKACRTSGQLK